MLRINFPTQKHLTVGEGERAVNDDHPPRDTGQCKTLSSPAAQHSWNSSSLPTGQMTIVRLFTDADAKRRKAKTQFTGRTELDSKVIKFAGKR